MWSHLLTVAGALLLLPAQAMADAKEKVAALAPSGLVLVMDERATSWWPRTRTSPSFLPPSPRS
jgi:serine-type D-Ala-D-Ala carboxypeptidase/endopeptidase (penicillin-binding protein 4)